MKKAKEIIKAFLFIPFFWMLYDQQSTTWIEQGTNMKELVDLFFFSFLLRPEQMQAINGILILLFIPLFSKIIYPFLEKRGIILSSRNRMSIGMVLASLSFIFASFVEFFSDAKLHILWQTPQYIMLTAGEIMLSLTGIEYVYKESPDKLKGLLLSGWLATVALGNLYVVLFTFINLQTWIYFLDEKICNYLLYATIGLAAAYFSHKNTKDSRFKD